MSNQSPGDEMQVQGCVIESVVGTSQTTTVYRARLTSSRQAIALKIREVSTSVSALSWSDGDLETLSKLAQHRFIGDAIAAGTADDDSPYVIMPFYSSGTLDRAVRLDGPLSLEEAVWIIARIAAALDAAHHLSVIHRYLTPASVFFRSDATPVVVNFGLGPFVLEDRDYWRGTSVENYAAPEVLADGRYSVASDVYSLGAVALFMLTGQVEFPGGESSVTPHSYTADWLALGNPVRAVLRKSMSSDPAQRPRSPGALAREFADLLGKPVDFPEVHARRVRMRTGSAEQPTTQDIPTTELSRRGTESSTSSRGRNRRATVSQKLASGALFICLVLLACVYLQGQRTWRVRERAGLVVLQHGLGLPIGTSYETLPVALEGLPVADRSAVRKGVHVTGRSEAADLAHKYNKDVTSCQQRLESGCPVADLTVPKPVAAVQSYPHADQFVVSWGKPETRQGARTVLDVDQASVSQDCPSVITSAGHCVVDSTFGTTHIVTISLSMPQGRPLTRSTTVTTGRRPGVTVLAGPRFQDGTAFYCQVHVDVIGLGANHAYRIKLAYKDAPGNTVGFVTDDLGNYSMHDNGIGYRDPLGNLWVQASVVGLTDRLSPWACN